MLFNAFTKESIFKPILVFDALHRFHAGIFLPTNIVLHRVREEIFFPTTPDLDALHRVQ